jgi:hypothetical protein
MLTQNNYGYYIHGKAPWGESDLPLSWIKRELDNEKLGNQKSRQFSEQVEQSDNSVISTYEIFVSEKMRQEYDILVKT